MGGKWASATSVLDPLIVQMFGRGGVRNQGSRQTLSYFILALALTLITPSHGDAQAAGPADVDSSRIVEADKDPGNWLSYGRTYNEQRFSPLTKITVDNAKQLGLAWYSNLDSVRGQEATPLVIDGVMYVATAWSIVKAYDAKTGALLSRRCRMCTIVSRLFWSVSRNMHAAERRLRHP